MAHLPARTMPMALPYASQYPPGTIATCPPPAPPMAFGGPSLAGRQPQPGPPPNAPPPPLMPMPVLPHGFQGRAPLRTAPAASYPINAHTLRKNYRSQHRCTAQAAQQALKPVAQQAPAKKRKGHYKRRRKSKKADKLRPPTCLPQIGVCFSPDQEWRQGLANIQDGTRSPVLGTNADVLDALERRSQQVDAGGVDDESGDEASCSGGVVDSSDCESDAKHQPALPGVRETLPEPTANATWLHAATREELIEYALWLEGEVCRLRTDASTPKASAASPRGLALAPSKEDTPDGAAADAAVASADDACMPE